MNIGLGIGIPFAKSQIWLSLFDPSKLFTSGVNGAWYDPSDINLTWRRNLLTYSEQFDNAVWSKTSTTVTPNAAIAPDGTTTADKLIADTSNAVHALNFTSNSVLGACTRTVYAKAGEVSRIEVSAYYPSTDYAAAIFNLSSGTVVFTTAGDTATISSISDGWYRCSLTTTRGGSTNFGSFSIRPNIGGGQNGAFTGDGTSGIYIWGAQLEQGSTATPYQRITDGVQDYLQYQAQPVLYRDAAGTLPVTAVEQPVGLMKDKSGGGNHAFNSSGNSANFPVLSARYNLLTKTEDISAADWTKGGATAASTSSLLETATTGAHYCTLSSGTVAATYIYSVKLKANGRTRVAIAGTSSFGGNLGSGVFFDLGTGSYVSGATGTPSITALADGWYQVAYTWPAFAADGVLGIFLVDSGTTTSYAGDVTKGVLIKEADLRVVNDALNQPAYQRVNTATDYDTVGFKPYVRFNGVSQWLQTNSIDFSYSDKMFVCAGVRKLSDAAVGIVAEFSALFYGNNGTFALAAPGGSPAGYEFSSRGSLNGIINTGWSAPTTTVVSGIGNISGDQAILRVNGAQAATSTSDQGTGNFGNYPLYIGARAGNSLFFNGHLYQLVIAGKQVSDLDLIATENFVETKTFGKDMSYVYSDEVQTSLGESITTAGGEQIYMQVNYQ